jgi:hypothetical protein
MGTVTLTGTREQLLRMSRMIEEAANEAKDGGNAIVITLDNAAGYRVRAGVGRQPEEVLT